MNNETKIAISPQRNPLIIQKLIKTKEYAQRVLASEGVMKRTRDILMIDGWHFGRGLCELKELVGHGNWLLYLNANFKEFGNSDDYRRKSIERFMTFYQRNKDLPAAQIGQNLSNLTAESERKFMHSYLPKKDRMELEGDRSEPPEPHYLTFVNHFRKWTRHYEIGQALLPSVEVMRREFEPVIRWVKKLCGEEWVNGL